MDDADLAGTFGGDAQLEGGCAWLDAEDGTRYEVLFPDGWRVEFEPSLQLLDPQGNVRAQNVDRIGVNGSVDEDLVSICQVGPIFRADEVLTED